MSKENALAQKRATHHRAKLGFPDKGRAINCDLEPLDLLNGLVLVWYKPSPEVLIVSYLLLSRSISQQKLNIILESNLHDLTLTDEVLI